MPETDPTLTIVRLLVATALSDTTNPPCWCTDGLIGAIEKLVVHTDRQPALFAEICEQALPWVTDPNNRAIIRLGIINGRRRVNDLNVEEVQCLFNEVRAEIDALQDGPRKSRCRSFWRYQARVFMARNGFYAEAAKAEEEEMTAEVAPEARAVSRFLSHLYGLWSALNMLSTTNTSNGTINLLGLHNELQVLQQFTKGTSLEVKWGGINGPIHLLQAMLLMGICSAELWDSNLKSLQSQSRPSEFEHWTLVFEAEDLRRKGQLEQAENLAATLTVHTSEEVVAFARLILAHIYRQKSDVESARSSYQLIKPAPNTHIVAAVAARELAMFFG